MSADAAADDLLPYECRAPGCEARFATQLARAGHEHTHGGAA
jgi:hypothetical protein